MRNSDGSSDVCLSDLRGGACDPAERPYRDARPAGIRAASPADVEGAGADASFRRARSAFARPYAHDRRGAAMSGFGMVLMRRAKVLARDASDRMAEAMIAAAEAELPNGVEIGRGETGRSEWHTSELQSLMRRSYADFCLKKKNTKSSKQ